MTSRPSVQRTLESVCGIEFWLERKRVKNINIRIKPPDGRIEVSAPLHCGLSKVKEFVASKSEWIQRASESVAESPSSRAEQATEAEIREWRKLVEACTVVLLEQWEPIVGVHASRLAFRNMKSRWGSCQPSTGRVCINTRLALYPPECLEYVVVHELCHMIVRGHGPEFHALMDNFMPDWRTRRAKLR